MSNWSRPPQGGESRNTQAEGKGNYKATAIATAAVTAVTTIPSHYRNMAEWDRAILEIVAKRKNENKRSFDDYDKMSIVKHFGAKGIPKSQYGQEMLGAKAISAAATVDNLIRDVDKSLREQERYRPSINRN